MWSAASQMDACFASAARTPPKSPVMGVLIRVQWPPRSVVSSSVPAFPVSQQTREEGAEPAVRFAFAPVSSDLNVLPPSVVNRSVPGGCIFQNTWLSGVRIRPTPEVVNAISSLETPCFFAMAFVCTFGTADSTVTVSVIERGALFSSARAGALWAATPPALPPETAGAGGGAAGGTEAMTGAFSETAASVEACKGSFGAGAGTADILFSRRPPRD